MEVTASWLDQIVRLDPLVPATVIIILLLLVAVPRYHGPVSGLAVVLLGFWAFSMVFPADPLMAIIRHYGLLLLLSTAVLAAVLDLPQVKEQFIGWIETILIKKIRGLRVSLFRSLWRTQ